MYFIYILFVFILHVNQFNKQNYIYIISDRNWGDSDVVLGSHKHDAGEVRAGDAGAGVRVRVGFRVVVGPAGVADPERDLPAGDPRRRLLLRREHQHALHLPHRAGLPHHALPHALLHLLLLRRLDRRHAPLRRLPAAGDQGRAH